MKEVPVVDIKITDLKKLYQKGYNMLEELRHEADAPVVKAKIFKLSRSTDHQQQKYFMIQGISNEKVLCQN